MRYVIGIMAAYQQFSGRMVLLFPVIFLPFFLHESLSGQPAQVLSFDVNALYARHDA